MTMPCSSSIFFKNRSSFALSVSFLQPTPRIYFFGCSSSSADSFRNVSSVSSAIRTSTFSTGGYAHSRIPGGMVSSTARCPVCTDMVISSPANTFADTLAIPSRLQIRRSFLLAKISTAKLSCKSVAVVITGMAPNAPARRTASSLAPPTCPDNKGITYFPISSATSTGLSCSLSMIQGAMARTAIPQAPMNISAWRAAICSPAHADRLFLTQIVSALLSSTAGTVFFSSREHLV